VPEIMQDCAAACQNDVFYSLKLRTFVTCPSCSQKAHGWWSAQVPLKHHWSVLTRRRQACC